MAHRRSDLLAELASELQNAEAEALLARLEAHVTPLPAAAETKALIDRLRPLTPRSRAVQPARFREGGLTREPLAGFLGAQAHHFRPAWWLASLAFVLLGLALQGTLAAQGLSVAALAPVLVIGGVAYAFRSLKGAALELEMACPITPTQVTLSRILVPLSYYLVLGTLPALAAGDGGRALLAWTAALFLFTGLFLTLTLYIGSSAASVTSLVVWGALIALHVRGLSPFALAPGPAWIPLQFGALTAGLLLLLHALAPGRIYRLLEQRSR